jgi:AcrR family transcriptional regulator
MDSTNGTGRSNGESSLGGLRQRQKEDRQKRIASVAKELFTTGGYEKTTIEGIADAAGVSGVTVHNYFGTKAGVLLALVADSDRQLIDSLEDALDEQATDLVELTVKFAHIIMEHALSHLEKVVWRQVIAAVTTNAGSELSKAYFELDRELARVLVRRIEALQEAGKVPSRVQALHLGKALFQIQNARFIQFISSDELTSAEIETKLRNDLTAVFSVCAT